MTSEAEILVHIAAPSTSKDDALYRTFATAYLNFEPGGTVELPQDTRSTYPAPPLSDLLSPQASFQSVWDNVRAGAARPHSQQSGRNSSQHGKDSQDFWVQPPSEVADSMPDNDISFDGFTTPTRIMKYFLQTAVPPSEPSQEAGRRDATSIYAGIDELNTLLARGTDSIIQENDRVSTAQIGGQPNVSQHTIYEGGADFTTLLARGANTILQGNDYVSTAPARGEASSSQHDGDVRYETPDNDRTTNLDSRMDESHISQTPSSPLRLREVPPPPSRSSGEPGARTSGVARSSQQSQSELPGITIPATQLPGRAGSEPPSSKRMKISPLQGSSHGLGRSSSDILPRGSSKSTNTTPAAAAAAAAAAASPKAPATEIGTARATPHMIDWTHETQLMSAEPPPANHKLGPRVPVKLELLMSKFGMEGRYKPKFQARKMRDYERGYWLLNLDGWNEEGKVVAWGFLGNYIRKDGFAGWGTRACRDEDWKWIRLYGWEHIAGELYILLYVASYRRLKAMEITWYDGAGKELIVVGARSEKSILDWSDTTMGVGLH